MYESHRRQILRSLRQAHDRFYEEVVFAGPSLHFHHEALRSAQAGSVTKFATNSYAMLAAWGMHRMGPKGAKMGPFDAYLLSLKSMWPTIRRLQSVAPQALTQHDWTDLKRCFFAIRVMRSESVLVAHSKVLAHAIPNLVPPIDREYTVRWLKGKKNYVPPSLDGQWSWFEEFLREFFYPVEADKNFRAVARHWMTPQWQWNTSRLKVIDNLVIGLSRRAKEQTSVLED